MAWATPTYITGQLIDSVAMNQLSENMQTLGTHSHSGGSGQGAPTLFTTDILFKQIGTPTAPTGANVLLWVGADTLVHYSNSTGSYVLADSTHGHVAL